MPFFFTRVLAWIWTRLMNDRLRTRVMWLLNAKFAAGVTAVVRNERAEVLLVEHAFRKRYPWALPGGWIERGERPEEAAVRELAEETGLVVRVERILAANTFRLPRLDVVYLCAVQGGQIRGSAETPHWRWCAPDDYPVGTDPYSLELVALAQRLAPPARPASASDAPPALPGHIAAGGSSATPAHVAAGAPPATPGHTAAGAPPAPPGNTRSLGSRSATGSTRSLGSRGAPAPGTSRAARPGGWPGAERLSRAMRGADRVPWWAWCLAATLLVTAVAVLVIGRGGTAVLAGAGLAFGALAAVLLSMPDRDPQDEPPG